MPPTKPFLRWAGGKRWLADRLHKLLAPRLAHDITYFEPFLGSGALFFRLGPRRALLSDFNGELINTYRSVASAPLRIAQKLAQLASNRATFNKLRDSSPRTAIDRAVRFIYLNRNCWGGLYRENLSGKFNTPWGGGDRDHFALASGDALIEAAKLLRQRKVSIRTSDFELILDRANAGDIVYCDPTYRSQHRYHFDRYGQVPFDWFDQQRLARAAWRAFDRGALVLVSNLSNAAVRRLYDGAGILSLRRRPGIAVPTSPQRNSEYLFVLDPLGMWLDWSKVGRVVRRQS
jgi:DNA adenine methylase